MAIFIIVTGKTIFSDLKRVPEKPISPSYCISSSVRNLENLTHLNCPNYYGGFNEVDQKFGLDVKFNNIKPQLEEILSLNKSIISNKREIKKT